MSCPFLVYFKSIKFSPRVAQPITVAGACSPVDRMYFTVKLGVKTLVMAENHTKTKSSGVCPSMGGGGRGPSNKDCPTPPWAGGGGVGKLTQGGAPVELLGGEGGYLPPESPEPPGPNHPLKLVGATQPATGTHRASCTLLRAQGGGWTKTA